MSTLFRNDSDTEKTFEATAAENGMSYREALDMVKFRGSWPQTVLALRARLEKLHRDAIISASLPPREEGVSVNALLYGGDP